jgi:transcription elongation factor Elf1
VKKGECSGEGNVDTLLCAKCNTIAFKIVHKYESGEIVAKCGTCGQETDLEVLVGSRYQGAMELVAALSSLYWVYSYKAKQKNDEVNDARYSKKYSYLQDMLKAPQYPNPLDMAAELFRTNENTSVNVVEAKVLIDTILKKLT